MVIRSKRIAPASLAYRRPRGTSPAIPTQVPCPNSVLLNSLHTVPRSAIVLLPGRTLSSPKRPVFQRFTQHTLLRFASLGGFHDGPLEHNKVEHLFCLHFSGDTPGGMRWLLEWRR